MSKTPWLAMLLLSLSACSNEGDWEDRDIAVDSDTGDRLDEVAAQYVINVFPNRGDVDGPSALPQTFFVPTRSARDIELLLADSVQLDGTVTGYRVTPRSPTLPGQSVPVQAEVRLVHDAPIQSRFTATSEVGSFSLTAVPDDLYTLAIVPDEPALPVWVGDISLLQDAQVDVDIGAGVAVWGQVLRSDGTPLPAAEVVAVHQEGVRTTPTLTDDDGFYLLRVTPGPYAVEVAGRDSGRDPTLLSTVFDIGEGGLRHDVTYDSLTLVNVGGRVVSGPNGVAGARVRLTAVELDTYEGRQAELQVDAITNSAGNFDSRVIAGSYTVEVLPPAESTVSYVRLEDVRIDGDTDLGTLVAAAYRAVEATVVDPNGQPVVGAGVRCTEAVGDGRSEAANTDVNGLFTLTLPRSPMSCFVTPPGGDDGLAASRLSVDLSSEDLPNIELGRGEVISGVLTAGRGVEVGLALVEVRDGEGRLWGSTVSDPEGAFSLRVDWVDAR